MYLKRLELLGFKTFVSRTEFVFDSGVTAIVGPNGSGKSNVADAVRWVLGEQSTRPLRIKRTEDVIFGGSAARNRLGMAEVSITFDNSERWLPLDYGEVTITRRAYRSGENEYFINKGKVRLRDVVDLLLAGNIGQNNYTVIGQGTVDAALSLRPEERRGLFEEAADIKRYQVKRADALEKLAATDANLVRIGDILAEIGPRVHLLEEQARKATEHAALAAELRGHLAAWYRHLWTRAQEALAAATLRDAEARSTLAALQAEADERAARLAALRDEERERRQALSEWHRQASDVHGRMEAVERRLAVDRERAAQAGLQSADLVQEAASLETAAGGEAARLAEAEAEVARLESEGHRLAEAVQAALARVSALTAERARCERELNAAQDRVFTLASAAADSRQRLASLTERRSELGRNLAEHTANAVAAAERGARLAERVSVAAAAVSVLDAEAKDLTEERAKVQATLAAAQGRQPALQAAVNQRQQARQAAQTRLELLSRLVQSGEGYAAGVRAVLAASTQKRLHGVLGAVGSLLEAPAELETAVETALGGHLQDVVTETWDQAAEGIAHLKQSKAGRCTFWPLDTVRPRPANGALPRGDGVLGWALDLVRFDARYATVFSQLLGGILVVRDLEAARAVRGNAGQAILVTLGGETVRPAGSLSGGAPERSAGVLAREREVRELPAQIAAREAEVSQAQAFLDKERLSAQQAAARINTLEARQRDVSARRLAKAAEEAAQRQQAARAEQEAGWIASLQKQVRDEIAGLDKREGELKAATNEAEERRRESQSALETLRRRLDGLDPAAAQAALGEARTAAAVGENSLRSQRALAANAQASHRRLLEQVTQKRDRAVALSAQERDLAAGMETAQQELGLMAAQLGELQALIAPAEAVVARSEQRQTELAAQESAGRGRLLDAERGAARAAMDLSRAQEELAKLQAQIESEEALRVAGQSNGQANGAAEQGGELPGLADFPHQLRLDLGAANGKVAPLVAVPEAPLPPDQLKRLVDRLRGQMRALGAINPNAVAEYEETRSRHAFLNTQADDLQQAGKSLRAVVAELDAIMKRRFNETFRAVAEEFKRFFALLFNGGAAKLMLTDADDPSMTGIDIVAQPPGRRMQSLALLSGGERALTATALLFAILSVNPTPICVLDEVDAALDEANVWRFTQTLQTLSQRTQFAVITHNRVTMEVASALYGVSMGDDGSSRVISLKLDEAKEHGGR